MANDENDEHGHADNEECMNCVFCGACREDLDSKGICIPCGGSVEQ